MEEQLSKAVMSNDIERVKSILEYATKNHSFVNLNFFDKKVESPIYISTYNNNIEMVKLLINYANKNSIILEIDKAYDSTKEYPLLLSIKKNNIEMTKLLMNYADNCNIILNLNRIDTWSYYPVLVIFNNNNTEMMKLLMEYANKYNIILEVNKKENRDGLYPFLISVKNSSIELTKILIEYSTKNRIILDINKKCDNGFYPLLWSILTNNIELTNIIIDYALKNNIILKLNEKNIENKIKINNNNYINNISEINIDIMKLLYKYNNENKIDISFSENSKFLEIFEDMENGELSINKGDKMVIIDWNYKNGWAYGYIYGNESIKGSIPQQFLQIINIENIERNEPVIALFDFISNNKEELSFQKGDKLRVIDWNIKEGWAFGYKCGFSSIKGKFPNTFVKKENENININENPEIINKQDKNNYLNKIKNLINYDKDIYILEGDKYFEWKIENWDNIQDKECSPMFFAYNHIWKISIDPNGINENNDECINLGLDVIDDIGDNVFIFVNFVISIINFNDQQIFYSQEY
eukprot:jgi/Orpsp1_1/1183972/evm.model.c7180000087442.1